MKSNQLSLLPSLDASEKVVRLGFPAVFDKARNYRYTLWRIWPRVEVPEIEGRRNFRKYVQFIGLNPSTADEVIDDATMRRCIQFAKDWGYGALCMTNLFAIRSRDPKILRRTEDPIGKKNDLWLRRIQSEAGIVIACWGTHGTINHRDEEVLALLTPRPWFYVLGLSRDGHPLHPLRLAAHLTPQPWRK